MPQIKYIDKDTDLSNIQLIEWDLEVNNIPYNVYRIDNYYHCIGGDYQNNDYWCCPADQKPSYENLIGFNGFAPIWAIQWSASNKYRNKWGNSSIEYSGTAMIKRNDKLFYHFGARDMAYGLAKAQTILTQLREHPIPFFSRKWKDNLINRKIYYREQPALITEIWNNLNLKIIPIDKPFTIPPYYQKEEIAIYKDSVQDNSIKTSLLDDNIYWFRND